GWSRSHWQIRRAKMADDHRRHGPRATGIGARPAGAGDGRTNHPTLTERFRGIARSCSFPCCVFGCPQAYCTSIHRCSTDGMITPADPRTIEALTTEIIDLCADIHRAEYRLLTLIRTLDSLDGWNAEMPSCAHWL